MKHNFSMVSLLLGIPLFIAFVLIITIGAYWYRYAEKSYNKNLKTIREIYITNAENYSKYTIENLIKQIKEDEKGTIENKKTILANNVNRAFNYLYQLYRNDKGAFEKLAFFYLSEATFKSNNISFYVIDKSGRMVFNPFYNKPLNVKLTKLTSTDNKKPFLKLIEASKDKDFGMYRQKWPYNWNFLSKQDLGRDGLTCFVKFRPMHWLIIGRYELEPVIYQLKQKWVRQLSLYRYGKHNHGYIFVIELSKEPSNDCFGIELVNPNMPNNVNKCLNLNKSDYVGFFYRKKYLNDIMNKGYSFVKYYYKLPQTDKKVMKISYIKLFKEWNWLIGTGIYISDMNFTLAAKRQEALEEFNSIKRTIAGIMLFTLGLLGLAYVLLSNFVERKISHVFKSFEQALNRSEYLDESKLKIKQLRWVTKNLNKAIKRFKEYEKGFLVSFVSVLEARDIYTKGHSQRVAYYAKRIAKAIGLDEKMQEKIYKAGLLHDIGKIGIPDNILLKPGRLTQNEYNIIKYHSLLSYEILKRLEHFKDLAEPVKHHHEKCDGSGYPDGLTCKELCIEARILAIADIFDALTTTRPYRKAFSPHEAIEILKKEKIDQELLEKVEDVLIESFKTKHKTIAEFMSEQIDNIRSEIFKTDYMTGLLYITAFINKIREFISKNEPFVIIGINIKGISKINYLFSTEAGNTLITETAEVIKTLSKDKCISSRAYADVFYVACSLKENQKIDCMDRFSKEKLKNAIKERLAPNNKCKFTSKNNECITEYIDFKIYCVEYPKDGSTAEELIYLIEENL
ncbi:HD domain-containing phosphohydrolase [Hippea sp. KM1]|uniref:HD domain-containing phosphohydrolase n=1 Tax=Hippea sp. KM1 TaxID=944481 RepID=UPI0018DBA5B9|nr:HD domain-containing phosphohydrolase [Hippea sp. KM1]